MTLTGSIGAVEFTSQEAETLLWHVSRCVRNFPCAEGKWSLLPRFTQKLERAMRKASRRGSAVVLSTLIREEADIAAHYCFSFTHPQACFDSDVISTMFDNACTLWLKTEVRRGAPDLSVDEIEQRIAAFDSDTFMGRIDVRWVRRLKKRLPDPEAVLRELEQLPPRRPLDRMTAPALEASREIPE